MFRRRFTVAAFASLALPLATVGAQSGPSCGDRPTCAEVTSFVATVGDFRVSTQGRTRLLTYTVRFRNKTDHVLRLAYVRGSGVAIDDQGNRYVVPSPQSVRAIGEITDNSFDPKFALAPGETSDARFEMAWSPERGQIFGTRFEGDLTVREIDPATAGQFRAGREHALHFRALAGDAVVAGAAPTYAPNAMPAATPASDVDLCAGRARCSSSGAFTTEVTNVIPSLAGRHRTLRVEVKITNRTAQPLVLGYKSGTSSVVDDLGNRYYFGRPTGRDASAHGIGVVTGAQADPQFALRPGESRNASFELIRYDSASQPLGTSFTYDVSLVQLDVLAGNQVRAGREYAVTFPGLTAGGAPNATQALDAGKALIDRLRGRKPKP